MELNNFTKEQEKFGIDLCRRVIFAAIEMHKDDFNTSEKPALVLVAINKTAQRIFNDELQILRYRFEGDLGL